MTSVAESQLLTHLPTLKYGFGIAAVFFVAELVWGTQRALYPYSPEAGGYAAALAFGTALVATAYFLSCISSYHYIVGHVEGWSHPVSAKRAVRFHFIPVFNLYWNFHWPQEIARFVNWRMQKRRMSGLLVGVVVLLGALVTVFFDESVGLVIIFSGFAYISRCLRDALAAPPVPVELHANSGLDAASLTFEA